MSGCAPVGAASAECVCTRGLGEARSGNPLLAMGRSQQTSPSVATIHSLHGRGVEPSFNQGEEPLSLRGSVRRARIGRCTASLRPRTTAGISS